MLSSRRIFILAALLFAPLSAHAQFVAPYGSQLPAPAPGAVRVQVTITTPTASPAGMSLDDQKKLSETARIELYRHAKDECAVLSKAMDADCKLVAMIANVTNQYGVAVLGASGTGIYDLAMH